MKFLPITKDAECDFLPFRGKSHFADQTFSMLYAWSTQFHYRYHKFDHMIAVCGSEAHGEQTLFLLHSAEMESAELAEVMDALRNCRELHKEIRSFQYVDESELTLYRQAAKRLDLSICMEADENNSDYIYEREAFVELAGRQNKNKRGDLNVLKRQCQDLHAVWYEPDRRTDVCNIFDAWCKRHMCENCFYGCEKKTFLRFLEICERTTCKIMIAYDGEKPLSFAASEQINPDMVCYYYQKNANLQRGLTYWLNREMALTEHAGYLNLCEDMGLPGLRMDKSNLHPMKKKAKYKITMGEK